MARQEDVLEERLREPECHAWQKKNSETAINDFGEEQKAEKAIDEFLFSFPFFFLRMAIDEFGRAVVVP